MRGAMAVKSPTLSVIVPSPLVGEGEGGGDRRTSEVGVPPTPIPSPRGGGEAACCSWWTIILAVGATVVLPTAALAASAGGDVDPSIYRLMVFVIAIFVGYYVVWAVTPALHTPLMSVTNA